MGFCINCGSELREGVRFCENCGAPAQQGAPRAEQTSAYAGTQYSQQPGTQYNETQYERSMRNQFNEQKWDEYDDTDEPPYGKSGNSRAEQYDRVNRDRAQTSGRENVHSAQNKRPGNSRRKKEPFNPVNYLGIALLILAFIDFKSDPPVLTIILSLAIIAGGVFCLARRLKFKVITIISLVIAVICLILGFAQGSQSGFFKIPKDNDYEASDYNNDIAVVDVQTQEELDKASEELKKATEEFEKELKDATAEAEEQIKDAADDIENANAGNSGNGSSSSTGTSIENANNGNASTGGVDPDLKAFLDSYEAFMDEYVEFMKDYNESPDNMVSMLADYAKIMAKYEDFAKKADQYNTEEMSKEDLKYYMDVMNRINKKMLDVY